jgi:hypothetical protein
MVCHVAKEMEAHCQIVEGQVDENRFTFILHIQISVR